MNFDNIHILAIKKDMEIGNRVEIWLSDLMSGLTIFPSVNIITTQLLIKQPIYVISFVIIIFHY